MKISHPEMSLVVLIGATGSGKSTFARRHFRPTEVLTSDVCRGLVADDENDQTATADAFAVLHFVAGKRLARGLLTVVDATNVQPAARKPLVELARAHYVLPVAIVFDLPEGLLAERSRARADRKMAPHVVRNQRNELRRSLRGLEEVGFRHVRKVRSEEEMEEVAVERRPLWPDRRSDHGPFDLIGDVHGCGDGPARTPQQENDYVLDLEDVTGQRIVETRLRRGVTIRAENAAAALELMSRFAVDPKWLIYLPPTVSPSETSARPDCLEHPDEAFAYFRREGLARVVCAEKHMGPRAVVVHCRDAEAARRRFGVTSGEIGICVTRTGRRFFDDPALEAAFLARLGEACAAAGLWERLGSDWACLDGELMPWSFKARELLREQYAAVGAASRVALPKAVARLAEAGGRGMEIHALLARYRERYALSKRFVDAYRRYCWPVASLADLRFAPFHLLASEGAVHVDRDHVWHLETLAEICRAAPGLLVATPYRLVELADAKDSTSEAATAWWEERTAAGGEGMVVKPLEFLARGRRGLAQPALKCRGREYLRIIYGPEYTLPENLERLRRRGLAAKRSLALRELALGIEGLERFVRGEPLRRVHECVFGVLALESEPVDPRL